jgi:Transglutaminase-like superfamily
VSPASIAVRFIRLTPADRAALVRAGLLAVACEVALRCAPFPRVGRRFGVQLAGEGPSTRRPTPSAPEFARARWATDAIFRRWPVAGTCLRRSLVLGRLLREYDPVVRIGVARRGAEIGAHAWLEIAGLTIDEGPDDLVPLRFAAGRSRG